MKPIFFSLLLCLASTSFAQSVFDSIYLLRSTQVYFTIGHADLSLSAQRTLDSLADFFQSGNAGLRLRIIARTDSVGEGYANDLLSQQRAAAVQKWLVKQGIGNDKIDASALGEQDPLTPNTTEKGRKKNRCAIVEILRIVPMTTLAGQVTDQKTGVGISAKLIFRSKTRSDSMVTDTTGHYSVQLPKDSVVRIETSGKDHFFETSVMRMFGSVELRNKYKFDPNIALQPARPGDIIILHHLFFIGDQAALLEISKPELPKILQFMQQNAQLRFEIAGHVNHPGVAPEKLPAFDWKLSVDRAQVVYKYLRDHAIPAERMTYKGYGNREMLFPNEHATQEQQQQNRRVEIRVLGE